MKKEKVNKIIETLETLYPEAYCSLDYNEAYKLVVMVRLAAQCTDKRVNEVCKDLFENYDTIEKLAAIPLDELEKLVKPCGFYKVKAKDIKATLNIILDKYNSVVPDTMEELLTLPGVGRKSANLILGDIYNKPAVVVDTHCIRITNRLGLVNSKDPTKIEFALKKILPPEKSNDFCHRLVLFGRETCTARSPKCSVCSLSSDCPSKKL